MTGVIERVDGTTVRVLADDGSVLFEGEAHPAISEYLHRACRKLERVELVLRDGVAVRVGRVDGEAEQ